MRIGINGERKKKHFVIYVYINCHFFLLYISGTTKLFLFVSTLEEKLVQRCSCCRSFKACLSSACHWDKLTVRLTGFFA